MKCETCFFKLGDPYLPTPGSISAGSPAPIIHPVRMMPPSGASTPAPAPALVPEDTCPSCGNVRKLKVFYVFLQGVRRHDTDTRIKQEVL